MRATRIGKNGKPHISEKAFTAQVISLARHLGWKTCHFRPAQTQTGRWITAVQGDGKGFPDLVMARKQFVIFAELKTETGRMTSEQDMWSAVLPNCYLWRPSDYEEIERILK
jgi:hypothetical protein